MSVFGIFRMFRAIASVTMSLPVPVKNTEDPSIGRSLREIVRRAADATQYQKLIGPIEIVGTFFVQSLAKFNDVLIHRLSVLGQIAANNLDVVGSTTTERLGVAARATAGELEVFGRAFFNGVVSFTSVGAEPQLL